MTLVLTLTLVLSGTYPLKRCVGGACARIASYGRKRK